MTKISWLATIFVYLVASVECINVNVSDHQASETQTESQVAILKQIRKVNDDGSYTFGYEAGDGSFKVKNTVYEYFFGINIWQLVCIKKLTDTFFYYVYIITTIIAQGYKRDFDAVKISISFFLIEKLFEAFAIEKNVLLCNEIILLPQICKSIEDKAPNYCLSGYEVLDYKGIVARALLLRLKNRLNV